VSRRRWAAQHVADACATVVFGVVAWTIVVTAFVYVTALYLIARTADPATSSRASEATRVKNEGRRRKWRPGMSGRHPES
jgi:hypothetical protein